MAGKVRVQDPGATWETTMTPAWIAERLHMGAPGHVACLLYHPRSAAHMLERKKELFISVHS